ncbi:DUF3168 domain-containing protein [Sphingomonas sp. RT2P30]|uniref:DUF3168 domain-containing protein n=1 Tax=Parasphingomonas halimpatiens TaxID=3096162 RepID=UPI002FC926FA
MTDLTGAVQRALFAALSPVGGLPPVYSEVPIGANDLPEYPFTLLGDDQVTEVGGKDASIEEHTVAIHVIYQSTTKLTVRAAQDLVKGALHLQPITAAGAKLSNPTFQSGNLVLMDDGATYVGTQNFKLFAQPAG